MNGRSARRRLFRYVYRIFLPATAALLFLVAPHFVKRSLFFGSMVVDIAVRLWFTLCFMAAYIILSDLDRYQIWLYGRTDRQSDGHGEAMTPAWNVALGVMFGTLGFFLTRWLVLFFLPFLGGLDIPIAALNGVILAVPFILHRGSAIF